MRKQIRVLVEDRKKGKGGGLAVGDNKDVISMLVEDEVYANVEDIVDDVVVMFIAGTKTVQGTTTNFLGNYTNREEFRKKLHEELDPFVEKIKHDWVNAYEFEMTEELDYTKQAYYEVMRLDTPFSISSTNTVTQPCKIMGIDLVPGDAFFINMGAIHRDPIEWQRPDDFIPERFDMKSEMSLKPDGSKRNPLAFTPFLGGQRICLGKTFAELVLKYTLPMYTHFFSFEWCNQDHYTNRPIYEFGALQIPEMKMYFKIKNKVDYTP